MGTPRKAGRARESATKEEAVKRTGERDWREEKRKEVEAKLKTKNSLIRCHHDTTINTAFRQTEHCWQLAGESVFFFARAVRCYLAGLSIELTQLVVQGLRTAT